MARVYVLSYQDDLRHLAGVLPDEVDFPLEARRADDCSAEDDIWWILRQGEQEESECVHRLQCYWSWATGVVKGSGASALS